jgi:ferric-dicitrate binding protein FerR (iron transport regulator)
MSGHRLADLAAEVLRAARASIHRRPPALHDGLTKTVAAALTRKKSRRRRRRATAATLGGVAAALMIALAARDRVPRTGVDRAATPVGIVATGEIPAEATITDGAGRRRLLSGAAIGLGARIVAPGAAVAMKLSTGTLLRVRGEIDVVDTARIQRFELRAGKLDAEVAKLLPGERFLVRAGRAEIEVRGTAFDLSLGDCAGLPRPELAVREGTVAVRGDGEERFIHRGERWQAVCSEQVGPPSKAIERELPKRVRVAPRSSLGAQNQMFLDAVGARKDGRPAAALHLLEQLLETYPASPLTEAAMAERMRLLRDGDAASAGAAARAYLARFPQGFARAEAEALATGAR